MTAFFGHETYLSPLTWRYGSQTMRRVWSELHRRRLFRRVWVALATAQHEAGLVTAEQLADLETHQNDVDIQRAAAIEAEIHHDLMAEVRTYAEQCPVGGSIIHLGATSTDILDNADVLRLREALDLLLESLRELLTKVASQIERYADLPCIGFTHLQPAEPTTVGYRLAVYGQDLLTDWQELRRVRDSIRGKGLKGAAGTAASYAQLLAATGWTPADLERRVMELLGLEPFPVATQVYPRKQDWLVVNALAGLAGTLYRFAFDLRLLQSPPVGEWSEPFGARQVGSSAMPFKRNPINAENVDSLARQLAALPRVAWDNMAHSLLERTLDDSANRRALLPEACLLADELLRRARRLIAGLQVNEEAISRNLAAYGVFAATERLLMEAVKAGGDRQELHEVIREHSQQAWAAVAQGNPNPLADLLCSDERITRLVPAKQAQALLDASDYVGDAPQRARALAKQIVKSTTSNK
ncbi:MAG TPA: adenylosuccinate lyase [Anaerolineae bacterium]|nr:adenylosuccinate lyase [Anaerolineae bacterium]